MKRYYNRGDIRLGWLLECDGSYILQSKKHRLPDISATPQVLELARVFGLEYGNPYVGRVQCWDPVCVGKEIVEAQVYKHLSNGLYAPTGKTYSGPAPSTEMVTRAIWAKRKFFEWRNLKGENLPIP